MRFTSYCTRFLFRLADRAPEQISPRYLLFLHYDSADEAGKTVAPIDVMGLFLEGLAARMRPV